MKRALIIVGVLFVVWLGCILASAGGSVYESVSPANVGSIVFLEDISWLDTAMTISIRDYAATGYEPQYVETEIDIENREFDPGPMMWSKDGTLLDASYYGTYDFSRHAWVPRQQNVEKLMAQRGGAGPLVFPKGSTFDDVAGTSWFWQNNG